MKSKPLFREKTSKFIPIEVHSYLLDSEIFLTSKIQYSYVEHFTSTNKGCFYIHHKFTLEDSKEIIVEECLKQYRLIKNDLESEC